MLLLPLAPSVPSRNIIRQIRYSKRCLIWHQCDVSTRPDFQQTNSQPPSSPGPNLFNQPGGPAASYPPFYLELLFVRVSVGFKQKHGNYIYIVNMTKRIFLISVLLVTTVCKDSERTPYLQNPTDAANT